MELDPALSLGFETVSSKNLELGHNVTAAQTAG